MYEEEHYFTMDILKKVLQEYQWPSYELEIGTLRNIRVKFPACTLVFSEGYESRMLAYFLNAELGRTNTQGSLTVFDAARVIRESKETQPGFQEPEGLIRYLDIEASEQKVIDGLRNICILLQAYLLPCIMEGDFSWVKEL